MAAKIITHKPHSYCQIQFPNGERVLISLASSGIKVVQLRLAGIIPFGTVVEWDRGEGYNRLSDLFAAEYAETQDTLEAVVKFLSRFNSIAEVKRVCVG